MKPDLDDSPGNGPAEDWLRAVGGDEGRLTSWTADGVAVKPLYPRARAPSYQRWRSAARWAVSQRVDHPDPALANTEALLDLEGGSGALTIAITGAPGARGFGLEPTQAALAVTLQGVELDLISMRFESGYAGPHIAQALDALILQRGLRSASIRFALGCDASILEDRDLAGLVERVRAMSNDATALMADGRPFHEAGAGEAQELAGILAQGVEQLRRLERLGFTLDEARRLVGVLIAVDADVFLGTAKLRAMRRLWLGLETACGLAPLATQIHAETSWRMMTLHDPLSNVMRTSAACFAAGLGGADLITVLPHTLVACYPDQAARRLARNTSHIFLDEGRLGDIGDPLAGSGAIEALTDAMSEEAWALFQQIEGEGGLTRSLATAGGFADRISVSANKRRHAVACRTPGIVGTSLYPILEAAQPPCLLYRSDTRWPIAPAHRDAEPFEDLRRRAQVAVERDFTIHLSAFGEPAESAMRITFAANVFAILALPTRKNGERPIAASIICLCGTDAAYYEEGRKRIESFRAAGARRILMVGDDEGADARWQALGADAVLFPGCDLLALLSDIVAVLEETCRKHSHHAGAGPPEREL